MFINDTYRELLANLQDMDRSRLQSTVRRMQKNVNKRISNLIKHGYGDSHAIRRLKSSKEEYGLGLRSAPVTRMSDMELRKATRDLVNFMSSESGSYKNIRSNLSKLKKALKNSDVELNTQQMNILLERGENLHEAVGKISEIIGGSDWVKEFYSQSGDDWKKAEAYLNIYYAKHDVKEIEEMGLGGIEKFINNFMTFNF